jgi:uncharacterized protein
MRDAFADTLFWLARARPGDPWSAAAKKAEEDLGPEVRITTTEEVLTEFLNALAGGGPFLRNRAAQMVRAIMAHPGVVVVPSSHSSFVRGVERYEQRPDKRYSLTDCISMQVMDEQGIREILSNDHHFTQEGYVILIRKDA